MKIVPLNTSGRTKEQIVTYVESNVLHNVLIDFDPKAHKALCRCYKCQSDYIASLGVC